MVQSWLELQDLHLAQCWLDKMFQRDMGNVMILRWGCG